MNRQGVDHDGLHLILWHRRSANDMVHVNQVTLAHELQASKFTVHRVVNRMINEGRLEPLRAGPNRGGWFRVHDPARWTGG